jgi:hypothetical protein
MKLFTFKNGGFAMTTNEIFLMIADETGDTRIKLEWDPKDPESVKEMKRSFAEYRKKGYLFYECKGFLGKYKAKGKPIKEFDKDSKRLVGEKHFDDLKKILSSTPSQTDTNPKVKAEEVMLTETVTDTIETEIFDSEKEEPKNGSTYGLVNTVSGG